MKYVDYLKSNVGDVPLHITLLSLAASFVFGFVIGQLLVSLF